MRGGTSVNSLARERDQAKNMVRRLESELTLDKAVLEGKVIFKLVSQVLGEGGRSGRLGQVLPFIRFFNLPQG